jgi:hypothetical protein
MRDFSNNTFIVIGCSHVAGSEIEYTHQPYCVKKAWPAQLGKLTKAKDVVNLGHPGASNDRIFRTIQDYIINNVVLGQEKDLNSVPTPDNNTDCVKPFFSSKDIIVIIQWSGVDRFENYVPLPSNAGPNPIILDDWPHNELIDMSPNFLSNFKTWKDQQIKNSLDSLIRAKVELHDNLFNDFIMLQKIVNTYLWLKSLGIEQYHVNGIVSLPGFDYLPKAYKSHPIRQSYKNLMRIYRKASKYHYAFLHHDSTMSNSMLNKPEFQIKHKNNGHYNEEGHKHWARTLYDFWFDPRLTGIKKLMYHSNQC